MKRVVLTAFFLGLVGSLAAACGSTNRGNFGGSPGGPSGEAGFTEGGFTEGDGGKIKSGSPTTCEGAAEAKSYIGCDYWPTVLGNSVWEVFDFAVVVANGQNADAEVTVEGPNGVSEKETVPAGGLKKIYLPWVKELKGDEFNVCTIPTPLPGSVIANGGAYHLTSSIPVTVYQFSALEYKGEGGPNGKDWSACPGNQPCGDEPVGCFSFSNDASLLLPSSAWTGNYRVTGQKGLGTEAQGIGSYFSVTAASDDTTVIVKLPSLQTTLPGAGISGSQALKFTLAAGDVAQIVAPPGDNHDLSGALVQADKPVQVMAGTQCSISGEPVQGATCDHLEESVFPAETLGKHYIVAPPTSPGGTTVGHIVRFYGNADDTSLTYEPSRPAGCPTKLDAGQVVECEGTITNGFEVTGDHEFAVASFMLSGIYQDPGGAPLLKKGDPSQTLATSVEQYRTKYIFLGPDDYDENWVDIVAPVGTTVAVDGDDVPEDGTNIGADFIVIRHKLGPGKEGAHTLTADKPVGIQVMGFGSYTSYAYPGGLDLNQIAPSPVK